MTKDPVAKELESLNRTLNEISSTLKEQNRILRTMAQNYLAVHKKANEEMLPPLKEDDPVVAPPSPKTYGWSMAACVQRELGLNYGDVKIEQDDSRWIWTGDTWERVELPSGQA